MSIRPLSAFSIAILLAVSVLTVSAPLRADQKDPRLPALFKALRDTQDPVKGRLIANRIWAIWYSHSSKEIAGLVRDGDTLMQKSLPRMAAETFSRVIKADPTYAEGWNRRATARFLAGDLKGSIDDIRETLAREPRHWGALSGLGLVYLRFKNYRAALTAMEQALRINPHLPGLAKRVDALRRYLKSKDI